VTDKNIFCNAPWYELHIYWDGSLGICDYEDHKLYSQGNYNIATMSIAEWFNSDPVKKFRQQVLSDSAVSVCRKCYVEEKVGGMSRRNRSNQKSAIFQQAFADSFAQSPIQKYIDISGTTRTQPIDIHVDLGNYCNLACKMCAPEASSRIASQEVKWGINTSAQYIGTDWTRDDKTWNSFKAQLLDIPALNNIHFMGGETLLSPRLEDLVDTMIEHRRFDICFSFVTNGTIYRHALLEKLSKFRRVGIEISIETVDQHNAYQRQGTDTELVLKNLTQYKSFTNGTNITVSLRPAVSVLTIGYYAGLLDYAIDQGYLVKSLIVTRPQYMDAVILPPEVKLQYLKSYEKFNDTAVIDYNPSDPNQLKNNIAQEVSKIKNILKQHQPNNADELLTNMVAHCRRWDKIYGYNARTLYPELEAVWNKHGY
jgi:MoaA/NifB/PqqE/SkfB family radical SAM enzyme